MAYSTRRPGGGWSRVSSGTDYSSVVSNYAVAFQQALQAQAQTELESKVFNYKNGTLSYTDLKKFLNDKLATELPGSQKELDLRQLVMDLDTFETTKNRDLERSKLEAKYSKNGISAGERLTIETEILKFFKQGTPEYAEQLSTIATTKELQRQEAKNERIAELEGRLSDGGLSTEEQIQIMEQARNLSEKGTQEYSGYTSKIGLLKEQKQEEDLAKRRNEAVSGLLDKYAPGGLTDEEMLEINRTEQQFTSKDSDDYIKLKEAEAKILGDISGAGAGNAKRKAEEEAVLKYTDTYNRLQRTEEQFNNGEISLDEYIYSTGFNLQQLQGVQDSSPDAVSTDDKADLINRLNYYSEQLNKVKQGTGVVIRDGGKKKIKKIVDRADLGRMGQLGSVVEKDENGNVIGLNDQATLIELDDENGQTREYFVRKDGSLEEITSESYIDDETNKSMTRKVTTGRRLDSAKLGANNANVVSVAKPKVSLAPKESTNPFKASQSSSKSSSSSSKSSPSSSKSSSKSTTSSSKSTSNATKAVTSAYNPFKTSSSSVSYSTAKPIAKIGNTKVTKGNIKGTVDFGITEKVSSAAKKLTSKISSLFKKR